MSTDTIILIVEEILLESDSGLAILVLYENKEYWIPKSQIFGYDGNPGNKDYPLEIAQWLAEKKEMV